MSRLMAVKDGRYHRRRTTQSPVSGRLHEVFRGTPIPNSQKSIPDNANTLKFARRTALQRCQIRPADDWGHTFTDFIEMVHDIVKSKPIINAVYSFDQKGTTEDTLGTGYQYKWDEYWTTPNLDFCESVCKVDCVLYRINVKCFGKMIEQAMKNIEDSQFITARRVFRTAIKLDRELKKIQQEEGIAKVTNHFMIHIRPAEDWGHTVNEFIDMIYDIVESKSIVSAIYSVRK
jgi:hypothetical protein